MFPGAGIREAVAPPTSEDAAAVKNRYPPPTADRWTNEPSARSAEIARRAHDADGVFLILPFPAFAAVLVNEWQGKRPGAVAFEFDDANIYMKAC